MRASWFGRELLGLIVCCVGTSSLSGCGGQEFSSNQGSGASSSSGGDSGASGKSTGGSASGGGGSGSAGDQSLAGSPDPGGSSGSGGSGGSVEPGCACGPGQYCRDQTNDCFDCAELSRLRFDAPERLETPSSNQASHFPRVGETSTDLLYSVAESGLRYTSDFSTSPGDTVAQSLAEDSGPLLLPTSVMFAGGFNFAFDRVTEMGRRQLFFGQWQGGLASAEVAPGPYNAGGQDHSIAIATSPPDGVARAYWMTDRLPNTELGLVTGLFANNAPGGPVTLNVGQQGCAPEPADLTPWVAADGTSLFFSHTRMDACVAGGHKDIYTVLLQPATGQPSAPAVPLQDVNGPANDVEPSFSADFCDLYFASDRDGSFALYRARRR